MPNGGRHGRPAWHNSRRRLLVLLAQDPTTMNFALILFLLTLVTGVLWSVDRVYFAQAPRRGCARAGMGRVRGELLSVLLVVFPAALVRRGAVQDSVVVDAAHARSRRFHPGQQVRVRPAAADRRAKVVPLAEPQRGDVVVFRYPVNPSQDFIKRVVGVGGDVVTYQDKKLTVNGSRCRRYATAPTATSRACGSRRSTTRIETAKAAPGSTHTRSASIRRPRPCIRRTCVRFRPRELRLQ
jgi:signal peptidase I